eukprot:COSAG01_NODE_1458_length_10252_cov_247.726288_6_plen_93_part_00
MLPCLGGMVVESTRPTAVVTRGTTDAPLARPAGPRAPGGPPPAAGHLESANLLLHACYKRIQSGNHLNMCNVGIARRNGWGSLIVHNIHNTE